MKRNFLKNLGVEYTHKKISILIQIISVTKEGAKFSNEQIKALIKSVSTYINSVGKLDNSKELFGEININPKNENIENLTFYKYISKSTCDNFISKGKFQFGSLKYYREIERDESRDEKEGYSNLVFENLDRQFFTSVISGFNYYILCGTNTLTHEEYMSDQFGDYVMKIKNIKSFAESVKKSIGAKSWACQKVNYSDFKSNIIRTELDNFEGSKPDLSPEIFELIKNNSIDSSVFTKPTSFEPENEVRLIFEMDKNSKKKLNIVNQGLLDNIEIIKITANKK
ncbi:hypothetical protein P700755_002245 [Psychroflexus torquis ATCC 700755]|uniref:Uncharacterized protein n=1 Tax=Psychroflexus torquis (strain ATCC 700755 / CIP 106069 / ACAM 623) TaxID=313595 RepID=K4IIW7_PSYTT|nr:hypothetical protein [Psychroflexus torquis]AFU69031.1 hypothetical protein P700755_002245 [Psychroflexus torquis ATCC 700755]